MRAANIPIISEINKVFNKVKVNEFIYLCFVDPAGEPGSRRRGPDR